MMRCALGVDIGTSSSKAVLVDVSCGDVLATVTHHHAVDRPHPGWFEMDGDVWWQEFIQLSRALLAECPQARVTSVGVSGMGPCVLLTDEDHRPVRPAILYGIDTRATDICAELTAELGAEEISRLGGSLLTSQAGGPKIRWVADHEPDLFEQARRVFMPSSWLAWNLTGEYVLDHQSASQLSPLYLIDDGAWHRPWWERFAGHLEKPRLMWSSEVAGLVTSAAAEATGLPAGIPVIAGAIDAWAEAASTGSYSPHDVHLMYGTTMFLINTTRTSTLRSPSMWTTAGVFSGTRDLAGGLATAGALTTWVKDLTGKDYPELLREATSSPAGAGGLLMLPYFAGERSPLMDPQARGTIAGLTLQHTSGDIYRAALESTAMAVRHNIEEMRLAGASIERIVAAGGGTRGPLWLQIVSDVTGLTQEVPRITVGASYGAAFLSAQASGDAHTEDGSLGAPEIHRWNPIVSRIEPDPRAQETYQELFPLFRELYTATVNLNHRLAARTR